MYVSTLENITSRHCSLPADRFDVQLDSMRASSLERRHLPCISYPYEMVVVSCANSVPSNKRVYKLQSEQYRLRLDLGTVSSMDALLEPESILNMLQYHRYST